MNHKLYIIDSNGIYCKEYFSPRNKFFSSGSTIKAVNGFVTTITNMIKVQMPNYVCLVWDGSSNNLLKKKFYPEYKANRPKKPQDFYDQKDICQSICKQLGIYTLIADEYEADDVIASLTYQLLRDYENLDVVIVSADKDLGALLDIPHTIIFDPYSANFTDDAFFTNKKGYKPSQSEDILSFMGDSADNICPVGGIGVVSAVKLLNEYGTIEGIKREACYIDGKLGENLRSCIENGSLDRNRKLSGLERNIKLDIQLDDLMLNGINLDNAREELNRLGIIL